MRENHDRHPKSRPLRKVTHFIKAWRKHRKMTVENVAAEAGLTASMISQLETGRSAYTQNSLEAVATALSVEAWRLLCAPPGANAGVDVVAANDELMLLIEAKNHHKVEQALRINADAARRIAMVLLLSDDTKEMSTAG